jgi:hypothetical protein
MTAPLLDMLMLPFRLPRLIAEKVTPKVDLLSSDKSLDRRIGWGGAGGTLFGCLAALCFMAGGGLAGGVAAGVLTGAAVLPALALGGAAFAAATMASICNKIRLDCTVVKMVNGLLAMTPQAVEAFGADITVKPAPKAPDFNHAAATVLEGDLEIGRPLRFTKKPQPQSQAGGMA